jgi:hypothetical protein
MMKTIAKELRYIGKRLSVIAISLWCMYLIYVWISFGFLWFLLGFILTGTVLFLVFKNHMMLAIRTIEMQLWGKPLDKNYWQDEKPARLKFVWKKDRSKDEKDIK